MQWIVRVHPEHGTMIHGDMTVIWHGEVKRPHWLVAKRSLPSDRNKLCGCFGAVQWDCLITTKYDVLEGNLRLFLSQFRIHLWVFLLGVPSSLYMQVQFLFSITRRVQAQPQTKRSSRWARICRRLPQATLPSKGNKKGVESETGSTLRRAEKTGNRPCGYCHKGARPY